MNESSQMQLGDQDRLAQATGEWDMTVELISQEELGVKAAGGPRGGNGSRGWALEVRSASKVFSSSPGVVKRLRHGRQA